MSRHAHTMLRQAVAAGYVFCVGAKASPRPIECKYWDWCLGEGRVYVRVQIVRGRAQVMFVTNTAHLLLNPRAFEVVGDTAAIWSSDIDLSIEHITVRDVMPDQAESLVSTIIDTITRHAVHMPEGQEEGYG